MEASIRNLNEIFNGNHTLQIPYFQRHYVWNEDNWERFLEDMNYISKNNSHPYFFGSIILKQSENQGTGNTYILIDGQQRLTTLCVFYKALCLKTNENQSFNRLFRKDDKQESFILKHNHVDIQSFEEILNLTEEKEFHQIENHRILELYEYFRQNIQPEMYDLQKIKDYMRFVSIYLGKEDDEQQIFDSINSLGARLTTAELLKNTLFTANDNEDYFNQYWRDVFDIEERKYFWNYEITSGRTPRAMIDIFLHSFLQIKIREPQYKDSIKSEDKNRYAKVDRLFLSYKDFIKKHNIKSSELLSEIKDYADIFCRSFGPQITTMNIIPNNYLQRLNLIIFTLGNSSIIPYILYAQKHIHDINIRNDIFALLESFIMRRAIVQKSSMGLNNFFASQLIGQHINNRAQLLAHIKQAQPYLDIPDNKELKSAFHEQKLTMARAKVALYLIEISHPKANAQEILSFDKYHLDFMMPKKWDIHWLGNVNKEERKKKVHTLGNITLLPEALTPSIRDAAWGNKKQGTAKRFGLNHYADQIKTLEPYVSLNQWNEQEIDQRANDLYILASEVWKY